MNQSFKSRNTPQRGSYGVFYVRIFKKIDGVITLLQCFVSSWYIIYLKILHTIRWYIIQKGLTFENNAKWLFELIERGLF